MKKIIVGNWEIQLDEDSDGHLNVYLEHSDGSPVRDTDAEIADFPEWGGRFTTDAIEGAAKGSCYVCGRKLVHHDPGKADCMYCDNCGLEFAVPQEMLNKLSAENEEKEMSDNVRLELKIAVTYEPNGVPTKDLKRILEDLARLVANRFGFTSDTEAKVDDWVATVSEK